MRIAVDVMGGDFAPHEIVLGCVDAANRIDELADIDQIIMVGREAAIREELEKAGEVLGDRLAIVNAEEIIEMTDHPASAVRKKKDNSITRCMELVRDKKAQAMVSAGNSGAFSAAALFTLGRIKGVHRPVITAVLPTRTMRPLVLVDAGANMDCDSQWLAQFAIMGSAYAEKVLGAGERPTVGLLSIGTEEGKGNEATKEAYSILKSCDINFCGNVEGHDLFKGELDVAVCDGFVGNVVLKTAESAVTCVRHWIKTELTSNLLHKICALLLRPAFRSLKRRMDPERYGGAVLLGVPGVAIVTHGASTRRAIFHAIKVAAEAAKNELDATIATRIQEWHDHCEARKTAEAAAKIAEAASGGVPG